MPDGQDEALAALAAAGYLVSSLTSGSRSSRHVMAHSTMSP